MMLIDYKYNQLKRRKKEISVTSCSCRHMKWN